MSDAVTNQERIVRLALQEGLVSEEQLASVAGGSEDFGEYIRGGLISQADIDHLLGVATGLKLELNRIHETHFGAAQTKAASSFQSEAPILASVFEDDVVDTALPPEQWRPINEIFFDLVLFFWYLPLRLPRPVRLAAGAGLLAACGFACFKYWPEISTFLMPPHVEQPRVGAGSTIHHSRDPDVAEKRETAELVPSQRFEPSPDLPTSQELATELVAEPTARFEDLHEVLLKYAKEGDFESGLKQLAQVDHGDYSEADRKSHALATCTLLLAKGDKKAWTQVANLLAENASLDSDRWSQHFAAWLFYADKASSEDVIRRISEVADSQSPEFLRIESWGNARFGDAANASSSLKRLGTPNRADRLFLATAFLRDGLANPAKSELEPVLKSVDEAVEVVPAAWDEFGEATCNKIFFDAAQKLSKQLGGR